MQKRRLGKSNLEFSALGLGCMGMSFSYKPFPEKQKIRSLFCVRPWSVASPSSTRLKFTARTVTKNWLARRWSRSAEKLQSPRSLDSISILTESRGPKDTDSSPERIRQAVEGSLKRLRTDVIDLYYQHRVDPKVPIEDVAGAVKDLIQQGKVKYFGMSEAGVGDDPPRSCGSACDGTAKRVLAVVEKA